MTPEQFINKWQNASLKERSAAQSHFNDLCALVGEADPISADPKGEWFAFEYGAKKAGGGDGWADVWKKGCFGWEYKGKGKNLQAAFKQLQLYAPALQYPPLLIVCDLDSIVIHTAFTNAVQESHVIPIAELGDPQQRRKLKWAFSEPERLRPGRTRSEVTAEAAGKFAALAEVLRKRGHDPHAVAHFLNRMLFCLFAEDVELLPNHLFTRLLEGALKTPQQMDGLLKGLFGAMKQGGLFGVDPIPWFNGGLYDNDDTLPLERQEIETLLELARMDWQDVEPAIFGTLFERGLDPAKRSQLGAHYTDPATILRLINPTIAEPLRTEWGETKRAMGEALAKAEKAKTKATASKHTRAAQDRFHGFLERLRNFRVLDPACGSGNFLYLALQTLKDLEHEVNLEAEAMGLPRSVPMVGPENIKGIELNPYAAELARVTLWIGEIQWMLNHGQNLNDNPVLKPLENIEERDALINPDDTESEWPAAEVIVGNPPFLGGSKMLAELGEEYVARLRKLYKGRVPGGADLVTYWFEKARAQIETVKTVRAGLVSTNSIRGGSNRKVLERILKSGRIFNAWSDGPWVNEGAAVRVSLIAFDGRKGEGPFWLDGCEVVEVYADLTVGAEVDITKAVRLVENAGICFMGASKKGPFDIPGDIARGWLSLPNPNGQPNSEVLRPLWNGIDVTRRLRDVWCVDFGTEISEHDAALYETPFRYVLENVKATSSKNRDAVVARNWWRFARPRLEMREAILGLQHFIVTPAVAKHRVFLWVGQGILPDQALLAIARSDDTTFGILHSRFHELWSLKMCTWLGKGNDPRYTPTTTFETFPFPEGLAPNLKPEEYTNPQAEAIAEAARNLNELRERWLNPPEWVERLPEVVEGYPDRIIPKPEHEKELKKRTLTNLYNQRPAWLDSAHRQLDGAVAAAYGWEAEISDEEVLRRLLALNLERSANS
jgi:type II restriction/modification system DNA methylase subunit YeeA